MHDGDADDALPERLRADLEYLKPALWRSHQWMVACWGLIDKTPFDVTRTYRVAASLHHLAIEHHTGIHALIAEGIFGSAFALFRPQLEAYLRGAWFHHCASESAVDAFMRGTEPPSPGRMIVELERHEAFASGNLSRLKQKMWGSLCSFTHGGSIQVRARNGPAGIEQRYSADHVENLLESSGLVGYLASVGLATALADEPLANQLRSEYHRIFELSPQLDEH